MLSIAVLAVAGMLSTGAFAQKNTDTENCCNTECCQQSAKKVKGKKDKKDARKENAESRRQAAFKGITLTAEQQKAVDAVYARQAEARKQEKTAQKSDTTNAKEKREGRMEKRLAFLKEFQGILTPEQYITFLENTAVSTPHANVAAKHHRYGHHKQSDARHGKAPKTEKKSTQSAVN